MEILVSKKTNKILRVPTIILSPDNSLGLTGLRKAVIITAILCYKEEQRLKSAKRKAEGGKSRRHQLQASRSPLPVQLYGMPSILPSVMWDNTFEVTPTREPHLSTDVQGLTWALVIQASSF